MQRHGQHMPLILLMDNGSTEEDLDAYKFAKVYDIDLLVVDHHHPDEIVDQYLVRPRQPVPCGQAISASPRACWARSWPG